MATSNPEMIKIGNIFVRWDSIIFVFDTTDSEGKKHSCFYAGGNNNILHKCYEMTAQEIYDLIEKTKNQI